MQRGRHASARAAMRVALFTAAISLAAVLSSSHIVSAQQQRDASDESTFHISQSAYGSVHEIKDGLAVILGTSSGTVQLGSPVWLNIEVRNMSTEEQFLSMPTSICSYGFIITNLSDRTTRTFNDNDCDIYSVGGWPLKPGQSAFIHAKFPLSHVMIEPGAYTIALDAIDRYDTMTSGEYTASLRSNTIAITVEPRE
jgi:hypothetical protein